MKYTYLGLLLGAYFLLAGCATTTQSGAVGVTRSQLLLVSASQVEASAAQGFSELNDKAQKAGKLVNSGAEYQRLLTIAQRLAQQTVVFRNDRSWQWQLTLIDSPEINAACLPGGKIIFYTGLLRELNLTNAEIAAVMAHEMAHALREHGRERMSQAMAQGLATNIAGAYVGSPQLVGQIMHYSLELPNSREAEKESDRIGLELMARAGYDPRAAITLHQKMGSHSGAPPEFLSSHPSWSTRVNEINGLLPIVMPLYQAAAKAP